MCQNFEDIIQECCNWPTFQFIFPCDFFLGWVKNGIGKTKKTFLNFRAFTLLQMFKRTLVQSKSPLINTVYFIHQACKKNTIFTTEKCKWVKHFDVRIYIQYHLLCRFEIDYNTYVKLSLLPKDWKYTCDCSKNSICQYLGEKQAIYRQVRQIGGARNGPFSGVYFYFVSWV